jgi:linoleate 10R-lipoxygenase
MPLRHGLSISLLICVRVRYSERRELHHSYGATVYKDLPHPPSGYLSTPHIQQLSQPFSVGQDIPGVRPIKRIRYASRSDDGSGYNPLFPTLGKAGEPYARSVPSLHSAPGANLPDAGLLFDTLLKRDEDKFTPHPSGFSSVS